MNEHGIVIVDYPSYLPPNFTPEEEEKLRRLHEWMKNFLTNLRTSSKVTELNEASN